MFDYLRFISTRHSAVEQDVLTTPNGHVLHLKARGDDQCEATVENDAKPDLPTTSIKGKAPKPKQTLFTLPLSASCDRIGYSEQSRICDWIRSGVTHTPDSNSWSDDEIIK